MKIPIVEETHDHDHFHGTLDPALLTSEKGIWAVKWSMVGLLLTALLADTIHNAGGAATALRMDCAFDGPEKTEQAI
jgi:hypothetical protein